MWKSKRQRFKENQVCGLVGRPVSEQLKYTKREAAELILKLRGHVVQWSDPGYDAARQLSNAAFQGFPQIIVYCEVFEDVRLCLEFAHEHELWAVCRSGGHSTAGFSLSSEMVIDVSRLSYAVVDHPKRLMTVGAGTNFGNVNAQLDTYRLHVPGGGCEDVCVGGFVQGGGYGFTSRRFGMNCDSAVELLLMLADGKLVVASEKKNADLFWAVRGGTGNNFGVLLQVTYRLHELWKVWGFGITWPIDDAPRALATLQEKYVRRRSKGVLLPRFRRVRRWEGRPLGARDVLRVPRRGSKPYCATCSGRRVPGKISTRWGPTAA